MSSRNKLLVSLIVAIGFCMQSATAETQGWFASARLGSATLDRSEFDGSDRAVGAAVGYRWSLSPRSRLGVEAGYLDLGQFDFGVPGTGGPGTVGVSHANLPDARFNSWMLGGTARFDISDRWHVGAHAGFARSRVEVRIPGLDESEHLRLSGNGNGAYLGLSAGVDLGDRLGLDLSYTRLRTGRMVLPLYYAVGFNQPDREQSGYFGMFSLDLEYRFGR